MVPRVLVAAVLALACLSALAEARLSSSSNGALRRKSWGSRVLAKRGCNTTQQSWCNSIDSSNYNTLNYDDKQIYNRWGCSACPIQARDLCGSNEQCDDDRLCYMCPAFGWSCGYSSRGACGIDGVMFVGQGSSPSPPTKPHSLCGYNEQCGSGKCYKCDYGGWNCGANSYSACGNNDTPYVGQYTPPPASGTHDMCGSNEQCQGSANCYQCPYGGYNCGFSSSGACGVNNVPIVGQSPPPPPQSGHDECGSNSQCGSGRLCYMCPSGGYNCGSSSSGACGISGVLYVGQTPPPPPPPPPTSGHSLCGTAAQCPGARCYMCPSGGWNCGTRSRQACGIRGVPYLA